MLAESDASFRRALKWIVLSAIAAGLLSWGIEPGFLRMDSGWNTVSVGLDFTVTLGGIISFVFFVFLEHAVARVLGGRGSHSQLAFISATYTALLILVSGVLSGVSGLIAPSLSAAQVPSLPGVSASVSAGTAAGWFWVGNLLLLLVRLALDRVALRAVYQLRPWQSVLPVLVCLGVTAGTACGFTLLMSLV
jgi:hypothetical protein